MIDIEFFTNTIDCVIVIYQGWMVSMEYLNNYGFEYLVAATQEYSEVLFMNSYIQGCCELNRPQKMTKIVFKILYSKY